MMFHGDGTASPGSTSVYHVGIDAANPEQFNLWLDQSSGRNQQANYWDNTRPTSTQFRLGSNGSVNSNGGGYVGWIWTAIPGYSYFGRYDGNTSTDGPFIYTGFRPAWILIKIADAAADWVIYDATRDTYNPVTTRNAVNQTWPDSSNSGGSGWMLDILSNGFKPRTSEATVNNGSYFYVYAAFAEHPFGGGNVNPSPAR